MIMKLRSKIPRRKRTKFTPIKVDYAAAKQVKQFSEEDEVEVSCVSSKVSVNRSALKKRSFEDAVGEIVKVGCDDELRRITRSYYRKLGKENVNPEVSESSCVESCPGVDSKERIAKFKLRVGKTVQNSNEIARNLKFDGENEKSVENNQNEVVSGLESVLEVKFGGKTIKIGENRDEFSEVSRNVDTVSNCESNSELFPKVIGKEFDLICSEHLEEGGDNEYEYSSASYSDVYEDVTSEFDFEDYISSDWCESGSQFSEKSETSSSPTYQLLLQFRQQFCRSSASVSKSCSPDEFILMRFEDEEHEKSYELIRSRERKQQYIRDYTEEYCSITDYGNLVIQQRLHMVHWIMEQSSSKELHKETMFLGVSLYDRFLSKGYFKNQKCLQIAGIASLTLATRIEENQPYNSVRQRMFYVGSTAYSRSEVVAMEWLVQEVLNFQCYMPTMYNFLWFYLKAAGANEEVEDTAKNIAMLALLGFEQLCYWPSTVAAGLVSLASRVVNQDAACHRVKEIHIRTKDDDLAGCIKSLEGLIKYIS
ncbi:cyclin-SDS [Apium graveolens]|uniref:cyclin-SDS n=1 Tax=Apium graveolens TaxID=4045 RepID=UPI003D7C113B